MNKHKPIKKNDSVLFDAINRAIHESNYIFAIHAKDRQQSRSILDIDVLDILENKHGRDRKRNKSKDIYRDGYKDWNYCIESISLDGRNIRIIVSFDDKLMLVITVINLDVAR